MKRLTFEGRVTVYNPTEFIPRDESTGQLAAKGKKTLQVVAGDVLLRASEGTQLFKDLTAFVRLGSEIKVEATSWRPAGYTSVRQGDNGEDVSTHIDQIELIDAELLDFRKVEISDRFADRIPEEEPVDFAQKESTRRQRRTQGTGQGAPEGNDGESGKVY